MSRTRHLATPAVLALLVVTAACLDDSITGTRPLSFTLTADTSIAAIGQSVTFQFLATGTNVTKVTIDFGDGAVEELSYAGPVEVLDQTAHSFQSAGTYVVAGEAIAQQGAARDSVTITVN